MQASKEITGGQAFAAIAAVVLLAHLVPLLGMVTIPVLALGAAGRALLRTAGAPFSAR